MKKKILAIVLSMALATACLTACSESSSTVETSKTESSSKAETTTTSSTAADSSSQTEATTTTTAETTPADSSSQSSREAAGSISRGSYSVAVSNIDGFSQWEFDSGETEDGPYTDARAVTQYYSCSAELYTTDECESMYEQLTRGNAPHGTFVYKGKTVKYMMRYLSDDPKRFDYIKYFIPAMDGYTVEISVRTGGQYQKENYKEVNNDNDHERQHWIRDNSVYDSVSDNPEDYTFIIDYFDL